LQKASEAKGKPAASIAEQNRDVRRFGSSHDEIEVAVTVEIGYRNVVRRRAAGKRRTGHRREVIFAVAEKHGKGAVRKVGDDQVGVAIMIEVGDGDRSRAMASGKNDAVEGDRRLRGRGGLRWINERGESHSYK
jgi:hypothetical protein